MSSKLTLNMGDAAYAASLADGVTSNVKQGAVPEKIPLRRGKWTPEEEQFALRLIEEFRSGLLPLTDGTTLRTFLSKLLNCDPMRISKKFVGDNCIGKQVFRHASGEVNGFLTVERMEKSKRELAELERKFLDRLLNSSTTPTSSPRNALKESTDNSGERRPKKAKLSQQAAPDDRVHFKTGSDLHHLPTGMHGSGNDDGSGGQGLRGDMYSAHPLHPHQIPRQHQFQQPPLQHSQYSQLQQHHQSSPYLPPSMYPHDHQYYLGSDRAGATPSPSHYPPFAPHVNMHMNLPQGVGGGGSGGLPYPAVRTSSETSASSGSVGLGASDDWRQHLGGGTVRQMGPYDSQLNWHQQYLPSQQFFDQHQSQLRSMSGGAGGTSEQSEEGMLKAKGSFYKSIKSSSTSSLDLLGTLATSISRENLVSYGTSGDSSCALNTMGDTSSSLSSMGGGGGSSLSRADNTSINSTSNNLKRNSKSIQDFWMLVEMGDLSRPDQEELGDLPSGHCEDVDSAVFDIEDDKSQSQTQFRPPVHSQAQSYQASTNLQHSYLDDSAPSGPGGSGKSTVSRCESAPVLNTTTTTSSYNSMNASTFNGSAGTLSSSNIKDSKHDPVVLQSLLSMASAEHHRIDHVQPTPTSTTSASSTLPSTVTHTDATKQDVNIQV